MVDHDADFWPTFEEAELLAKHTEEHWGLEKKRRASLRTINQDYQTIQFLCESCGAVFLGNEAALVEASTKSWALCCPTCDHLLETLAEET